MDSGAYVASPSEHERETARRVVRRAMWVALWVWPAFTALDAYMCFVAYPGARFPLFVASRVVVELLFLAVHRASLRGGSDVRALYARMNAALAAAAVAIALMAIDLGGVRSPYMHGISIVAFVRAVLVPGHWRRSVRSYTRIGLAFPVVMAIGALVSPAYRAEWLASAALIAFAGNYVFVVASSLIAMITGHVMWSAQEQLYRARRVGRYRLQAPIGKGGMGEVWVAWDLSLRRNVALKILRATTAASADMVKRFEREARAAGQLRGQHIVQVFDFGASDDGLYYIAMEYLPGMDLARLVEEFGPMPPARAVSAVMQACRALEEAHAAGIIHRDLKPHNLFLTSVDDDPDVVKLLDFGVARLRDPAGMTERLTWSGAVLGTPSYLAPELWHGSTADERSDLYALGATLHFLVTGVTPAAGGRGISPAEDPVSGLTGHPYDEAVAAGLRPIVRRCMAMWPEDRFQSAHELHEALAEVHDPAAWTREDAQAFWRGVDRRRYEAAPTLPPVPPEARRV